MIWTLSGLYMSAVHIDIIHRDHFIRSADPKPLDPGGIVSPVSAAAAVPGSQTVRLGWLLDRPVYIIASGGGDRLVDARTGNPLPPPSREQVQRLADYWFTGEEKLADL